MRNGDDPESPDSPGGSPGILLLCLGIVSLVGSLWWVPRLGTMLFVLAVIYGLLMGVGYVLGALRQE